MLSPNSTASSSFQACQDNIKDKTGTNPDDFRDLTEKKGFLQNGRLKTEVKAGRIANWLKTDFGLGTRHSMAIYVTV